MKILFIGNSFTYYNDMPGAIFQRIAEQNNNEIEVSAVTVGGWSLIRFAEANDEHSERVRAALSEKPDVVVLQEQSHYPISAPEKFYRGVRLLSFACREVGATPYLYATWGYKAEHEKLLNYGRDSRDMEMKLRASYSAIGEELGITVCHVGAAMTYAYADGMDFIYNEKDHYHPALAGSAIAALTLYSTVFQKDPSELSVSVDGLCDSTVKDIVREVRRAIYERDAIPKEYRISSVGV